MTFLLAKYHTPVVTLAMGCLLAALLWPATAPDEDASHVARAEAVLLINGQAELAGLRFNEVAFATTHNAHANAANDYFFPNQINNMRQQLQDGIRGLMLDLHHDEGEALLCHGDCRLGKQPLQEGLEEIAGFLDDHPHEVVALLLEPSGVQAKTIARGFADSGLLKHAYAHTPGQPWPLMGEMVRTGQRLVTFTNTDPDGYPWLHPMWDYMWDTHWNVSRLEDFSCIPDRGSPGNDLFVLNHFILNPLPFPASAREANRAEVLFERAISCWHASGHIPNFITVDYYEYGDVITVAEALNRTPFPETTRKR